MRRKAQQGFSLLEMLWSLFLMLVIVLGLLPLFAQSVKSNESSEETSDLVRAAQLRMEGLVQLPFNDPQLQVNGGATEYIYPTVGVEKVFEGVNPYPYVDTDVANRAAESTLVVRHFNIAAIDDGVLDQNDGLPVGSDPRLVHFKQISMSVKRTDAVLGIPVSPTEIQMMKSN